MSEDEGEGTGEEEEEEKGKGKRRRRRGRKGQGLVVPVGALVRPAGGTALSPRVSSGVGPGKLARVSAGIAAATPGKYVMALVKKTSPLASLAVPLPASVPFPPTRTHTLGHTASAPPVIPGTPPGPKPMPPALPLPIVLHPTHPVPAAMSATARTAPRYRRTMARLRRSLLSYREIEEP